MILRHKIESEVLTGNLTRTLTSVRFVSLILARPSGTSEPTKTAEDVTATDNAKHVGAEAKADQLHHNPQKDIWIVIEGIEFFAARPGARARVVANVNGTEFVYPSRAGVEWLEIGPSMSAQIFRLPQTRERYIIRFEASVRVPAEQGELEVTGKLTSVKEDIVNVPDDIPFIGRYTLHTFDPVHMSRSASAEAELRYRITREPK